MNKDNLRRTIKQFLGTLTAVGVMATAPTAYSQSVQTVSPELTIQKLADLPTNREIRRQLDKESKEAFVKLYHDFSKDFSQKFEKFSIALKLFSSLLSDIVVNDDLNDLISINELSDLRDDIKQSIKQFSLLDKMLYKLEKLTGERDEYQIHSLFQQIIEAEKQVLSSANQFYATFYHKELGKIIDERQEIALVFDETYSRDDIRRALFGEI